jgi:uncharacterized BrkB/YihY/UPF0761 family membrane protein
MGAGIRRARTRAEEAKRRGIEIAERERGRRPSVAAAYELGHRDRQAAGALLAGGLAFRFFLWLLPLTLAILSVLGMLRTIAGKEAAETAEDAGLSHAAAKAIADGVSQTGKAWWVLFPISLWLLLWAAAAAARACRLVSAVAWRVPPGRRPNMLHAAGAFTGVMGGMILVSLVARPLFAGSAGTDILAWLLTLAAQGALIFWGVTTLPRPAGIGVRDLIPGTLLFVAGLAVLRIVGGVYFARELDKVASLYGSLGLSVVFLTWLYLYGRITVAGLMLNGVLVRQREANAAGADGTTGDA